MAPGIAGRMNPAPTAFQGKPMMARTLPFLLLLALLASTTPSAFAAETRYVSDQLQITLRTGKGTEHRIIRMLTSGTEVDVLETDDGYARVRTPGGTEGWVLTRFLMDQPAARERIAENEARVQAMQARFDELQARAERVEALEKENARLQAELEELRELSADTVAVHEENQRLEERFAAREDELERLREENARLQDRSAKTWFVRGAGVVLVGILVGLILPHLRRRRRSWGEF